MLRYISPLMIALLLACNGEKKFETHVSEPDVPLTATEETELFEQATALFGMLPSSMPGSETDTPERVALGRALFHDVRLSVNNSQSCNTCHNINDGAPGVDGEATSLGAFGKPGVRNSPTVLNAGYQFVQFWDGRAENLTEQAKGPILNPVEMAMNSETDVEKKLSAIPEYRVQFSKAFPDSKRAITYQNVAEAIAAFERTLISRSRFDEYMSGKKNAISNAEKRGLKTFIETGCITCHVGPALGGTMYQKLGLLHPYSSHDAGRYDVTKDPSDSMMFKVPILRNIQLTSPYFHDGSVKDLPEAVRLMAWHQLNKKLSTDQISSIVSFLAALSDPTKTLVGFK